MITRIRVEAKGNTENNVRDDLVSMAALVQETYSGEWEIEEDDTEVQSAKEGFWGRATIKRKP